MSVHLATKKETVQEVVEIVPGSIIKFDKGCDELLQMVVGGQPVAEGEAVKIGDKFGFRVTAMLLPRRALRRTAPRARERGVRRAIGDATVARWHPVRRPPAEPRRNGHHSDSSSSAGRNVSRSRFFSIARLSFSSSRGPFSSSSTSLRTPSPSSWTIGPVGVADAAQVELVDVELRIGHDGHEGDAVAVVDCAQSRSPIRRRSRARTRMSLSISRAMRCTPYW